MVVTVISIDRDFLCPVATDRWHATIRSLFGIMVSHDSAILGMFGSCNPKIHCPIGPPSHACFVILPLVPACGFRPLWGRGGLARHTLLHATKPLVLDVQRTIQQALASQHACREDELVTPISGIILMQVSAL